VLKATKTSFKKYHCWNYLNHLIIN